MNDQRVRFGPVAVDIISADGIVRQIARFIAERLPKQLITLNALMFNHSLKDRQYADVISKAAVVFPDSVGITWGLRLLTGIRSPRLPGIDLVHRICSEAAKKGFRLYLLGSEPGIAAAAAQALVSSYPGLIIAGTGDGYFSSDNEPAVIETIAASRPDILLVGLSLPRQELWIAKHLEELKVPVVMGVGGSFDVLSGRLRRAPLWMRRSGIEWLFRTFQQPWRIMRIKDLPLFAVNILRLKLTAAGS